MLKLSKDTTPDNQPKLTSPYMVNWNHSKVKGSITNEEANQLLDLVSEDFYPIGKIVLDNNKAVIFSRSLYDGVIDTYQHSEIGLLDGDDYSIICKDSLLDFKLTKQITGEFKVNINGDTIIYWTDDYNVPRYLNLTTLNDAINETTKRITDLDAIRFFPVYDAGTISLLSVNDTGGVLKTGVYYVSHAYLDLDLNPTNFLVVSGQISITNNLRGVATTNAAYGLYDGSAANVTTSKSFTVQISDLDTSYNNVRVAIIQVINQTPSVTYLDFPIVNGQVTFTYTGNETGQIGDITEVSVDRPSYRTCKDMRQYNRQLYLTNLRGQKEIGYQKYANAITLQYVEKTTKLNTAREDGTTVDNTDKDELIIFDDLGFMDDEVYAFYIAFLFKDGSWSKAYHIPGREASTIEQTMHGLGNVSNETDTVDQVIANEQLPGGNYGNPDVKSYLDGGNYISGVNISKFYQVYNTSTGGSGRMGFWQNENETYPDTEDWDVWNSSGQIGTLRNTNVRHHRFPNPANLWTTQAYYNNPTNSTATGRVLGIKTNDIYIPDEIKSEIEGYGIFYAQRDSSNSLVISQSCPLFPAFNTGPTSLRPVGVNRTFTAALANDIFQFSGFDLMIENDRVLAPTFMKNEFTLEAPLSSAVHGSGAELRFSQYTLPSAIRNNQVGLGEYVRQITGRAMIPHNSQVNPVATGGITYDVSNLFGQKHGLFQIDTTNITLTVPGLAGTLPANTVPGYLTNIYAYRQDVYNQFDQQQLRFTGVIVTDIDSSSSPDIYGGDTFFNSYGFRGTGKFGPADANQIRGINYIYHKSYYHAGYRQDGPDLTTAAEEDFYYPRQTSTQVHNLQAWAEEKFTVNKDYSLGNYLNAVFPKNKFTFVAEEDFSTRVIRSEEDRPESLIDNYRIFLANNYIDLPRDKGEIWKIETFNNVLLIHHERAIRRTIGSENLRTDSVSATLGNGDIFQVDPKDLIQTKEGYGGTLSQWASIITPYGYFFPDINSGVMMNLSQGLDDISDMMMNYFQDNLPLQLLEDMKSRGLEFTNIDNPASPFGIGISSFYDNKYKRLIFCKRDYVINPLKSILEADFSASFGTYSPGQLLYGNDKFYKVEFIRINDVDTLRQIIVDTFSHNAMVFTQVQLTDTTYFTDKSFTISYYPETKSWGSFYSFTPKFMYNDQRNTYSSISNGIYQHNIENSYGVFYDVVYDSVIDYVYNDEPGMQKTYGSISWISKSLALGAEVPLDTFYKAIVYNSKQCSGEVLLINLDGLRRAENKWNFNRFRDISISTDFFTEDNELNPVALDNNRTWYERRKFQDRYLIIRLYYNNTNQNQFILLTSSSDYQRISYR
jgi:hypothetical protein